MSSSGGGSSRLTTNLQRIMLYWLIIFGVAPLALELLLSFALGGGATVPFLTTYYVIAILGLSGIMFERLVN
ncbi:hypothetical protein E6H35_01980 [Candidatus Bathyarchaeota archaeon]|nr:MAG: hypothetical protein E6H35_01980 [Candidatus Bathyarchaeota archaeon]